MSRNKTAGAVDSIDREILQLLLSDGRLSNRALADAVNIAESTCHARLRSLVDQGVVEGFHAKVNMAALGRPVQAVVFVRVRPQNHNQVVREANRLADSESVLEIFLVTGPYDLLVRVAVASTKALQDFVFHEVDASPTVVATETHVVTSDYLGGAMAPGPLRARLVAHHG